MKVLLLCGGWRKIIDVDPKTNTTNYELPKDLDPSLCDQELAGHLVSFNKTNGRTDFDLPIFKAVA